jgi:hypothetical protein
MNVQLSTSRLSLSRTFTGLDLPNFSLLVFESVRVLGLGPVLLGRVYIHVQAAVL